jgi:hypothetical protein
MIRLAVQNNVRCWRMAALIPNLSAGKSKEGKKSNDGFVNIKDYHIVLKLASSSIRKYSQMGGFWWTDPKDRLVLIKPFILSNNL